MTPEKFIESNIRKQLPDINQSAIDAAIQHYRQNQAQKKAQCSKSA